MIHRIIYIITSIIYIITSTGNFSHHATNTVFILSLVFSPYIVTLNTVILNWHLRYWIISETIEGSFLKKKNSI